MGDESVWGDLRGTTRFLAVITPWRTEGQNAAEETVTFKHTLAVVVTDVRNIRGIVGRVESRGEWGIVDRGTGIIRVTFADNGEQLPCYLNSDG